MRYWKAGKGSTAEMYLLGKGRGQKHENIGMVEIKKKPE